MITNVLPRFFIGPQCISVENAKNRTVGYCESKTRQIFYEVALRRIFKFDAILAVTFLLQMSRM